MSRWKNIVLHHSLTKDSDTMSWDNIKHYHTVILDWDDIGYHFGLESIEGKPTILAGRPLYKSGAHCRGYNHDSIGICIVGDFNKDIKLTDEAMVLLTQHIAGLCVVLDIQPSHIYRHLDKDHRRTCPGKHFPFNAIVNKVINIIEDLS